MKKLIEQDLVDAAKSLGVNLASVKAVLEVEAPRGGFQEDGQVAILFERHHFHRHTNGRFSAAHPDISNPKAGGYGASSTQHRRLQQATALDRDAALKSASWGKPQILGSNYAQAGFGSLQEFINAMHRDERSQLDAFVNFIKNDKRLLTALRNRAWASFARVYNGPNYAINAYDTKLAAAYRKHGGT